MTTTAQPFVAARLSVMMFLQFFVWGAWYVTAGPFMGAAGMADWIKWAYTVGPIAAIISPFFLGMIADRFFATERVLAVMHILGGATLLAAPSVSGNPQLFIAVLFAHMLFYMPTLGLTNTLAFHNVTNAEKQFPLIRVLGTIGWIVAGLSIGAAVSTLVPAVVPSEPGEAAIAAAKAATESARASSPLFFYIAGGAAVLLGFYSFTLPHTPPPAKGKSFSARDALGLDAVHLLKSPPFLVFTICSFLVCIPLAAYYSTAGIYVGATGTPAAQIPVIMSFGQMSEIAFMLIMPLCFARLGVKWMLLVGMIAWIARYGLFAFAWDDSPQASHVAWMVLVGVLLHGICYDFFFVTGQIYVDQKAGPKVRGQAQGLLVLVTQGLGLGIGALVIGSIVDANTTKDAQGLVLSKDWQTIWLIPCAMAFAIAIIFFIFFRDKRSAATSDAGKA
jgi:nucleoside transporter